MVTDNQAWRLGDEKFELRNASSLTLTSRRLGPGLSFVFPLHYGISWNCSLGWVIQRLPKITEISLYSIISVPCTNKLIRHHLLSFLKFPHLFSVTDCC